MDSKVIKKGLDELAARDADVRAGLDLVGYPEPRTRPHGFETLLGIILGQQISVEAAAGIRRRLDQIWPEKTWQSFLSLDEEVLKGVGLSRRKAEYAMGVARAIADGRLNINALPKLSDQAVIEQLIKLRGIGVWSAEIYAMFSLGRRDIFPADDLALQEALRRLKGLETRPTGKQARDLVALWSPWRSVGSIFLWKYYRGAPD